MMQVNMGYSENTIDAFRDVLNDEGLLPGDICPDGKVHRCGTKDKPSSKNGWYVLHESGQTGSYGDWRSGLKKNWRCNGKNPKMVFSFKEHEKKRKRQTAEAIQSAHSFIKKLPQADSGNPYLKRKGVSACPGLKAYSNDLIVPVYGSDGKVLSFQRIDPDGGKKFKAGAPVSGGFFPIRGEKGGALYICEGLATGLSIYEATKQKTVLCAFSANNLTHVAQMARKRYPDRIIILCADNDKITEEKTGNNPGIESATEAAISIDGLLAVPNSPGDFNDFHMSKGKDAVQKCLEAAKTPERSQVNEQWPEPVDLIQNREDMPYPIDALPSTIRDAVIEATDSVQCPLPLAANSALAGISTVAAGHVNVSRDDQLVGPASLYLLSIAESGERKSTVDSLFMKPIRQWQAEQDELAKPKHEAWAAENEAWEAEKKGIIKAIGEAGKKGKDTTDLKRSLVDLAKRKPVAPMIPRVLMGDATSEALTFRLARFWPVAGMLSSEAGTILGGHSMNRDAVVRNLATMNALWSGEPLAVDRKTSESYIIHSARLTFGLAAQPETVRQWIESTKGLARGTGFLARFLISNPTSTQGKRFYCQWE